MAGPPWNFKDNAERCVLVNSESDTSTSIEIERESDGSAPASWPTSDFLLAIMDRPNDNIEIINADSLSTSGGGSETVTVGTRGYGDTSAQSWSAGATVRHVDASDVPENNPINIITTQGDLIVGDSNGSPSRLPSGNEGEVPIVQAGGGLGYGTVGGAWSKIENQTVTSNVSSVDFTNGIDSTYKTYAFILTDVELDSGSSILVRIDNGSGFQSTQNYQWVCFYIGGSSGNTTGTGSGSDFAINPISDNDLMLAGDPIQGVMYLQEPADSGNVPHFWGQFSIRDSPYALMFSGVWGTEETISGVRIATSGGNIQAGTLTLYGISQ